MADQSADTDQSLVLDEHQMKLMLHRTRKHIIDLLTERPATTSQLAAALDAPKGTIGHHCQQLLEAGLIRVVRTRKVRAIDEKYYGRSAALFIWPPPKRLGSASGFLSDVIEELDASAQREDAEHMHLVTARYARIPESAAEEWERRLSALADEFAAQTRGGETTYGVLIGFFPTDRRPLPDEDDLS